MCRKGMPDIDKIITIFQKKVLDQIRLVGRALPYFNLFGIYSLPYVSWIWLIN